MGKGKGGDGWGFWAFVGLLLAGGSVYYGQTGRGEENDAALIPNDLEGRIDFLVGKFNERFSQGWVDKGFDFLNAYVRRNYPVLALLVGVVVQVEQMSKSNWMASYTKQQTAVQMARRIRA